MAITSTALNKARALLRALSDTDTPRTENPYTVAESAMGTTYTVSTSGPKISLEELFDEEDQIHEGALATSIEEEDPFEAAAQVLGITRDDLEKIFENSVKWTEHEEGMTHTRCVTIKPGILRAEPLPVTLTME